MVHGAVESALGVIPLGHFSSIWDTFCVLVVYCEGDPLMCPPALPLPFCICDVVLVLCSRIVECSAGHVVIPSIQGRHPPCMFNAVLLFTPLLIAVNVVAVIPLCRLQWCCSDPHMWGRILTAVKRCIDELLICI